MKIYLFLIMKNKLIFLAILIVFGQRVVGQEFSQDEVKSLRMLYKGLQKADSVQYNRMIDEIYARTINIGTGRNLSTAIRNGLDANSRLNNIAELVNPSSTSLTGKSYNTYIREVAKEAFIDAGSSEADRGRFTKILDNLTSSQNTGQQTVVGALVQTALAFTPVSGLVNGILSSASSWFSTATSNDRVKSISAAFGNDKLKGFYDKLKPYTEFYDQALELNRDFGKESLAYINEAKDLDNELTKSRDSLLRSLELEGVKANTISTSLLKLKFPRNIADPLTGNPKLLNLHKSTDRNNSLVSELGLLEIRAGQCLGSYLAKMTALSSDYREVDRRGQLNSGATIAALEKGASIILQETSAKFAGDYSALNKAAVTHDFGKYNSLSESDSKPKMIAAPKQLNADFANEVSKFTKLDGTNQLLDKSQIDFYSVRW